MTLQHNPILPEERAAIIAALSEGPRDAAHRRAVAEKFGRSKTTIYRLSLTLGDIPPVDMAAFLDVWSNEPTRLRQVIAFARAYGKPFSFKFAKAHVSLDGPALNVSLSRLVGKGMLTRRKMPLTTVRGGTSVKIMAWVYFPTPVLMEPA